MKQLPVKSASRTPYKLSVDAPDATHKSTKVTIVVFGFNNNIKTSLLRSEIADHIGLIVGGKFADYQFYEDEVADYSKNYSVPCYYPIEITCNPDKEQVKKMTALSEKWTKAIPGGQSHQKWPYNCRAYVAYVLFGVLGLPTDRDYPGLGTEYKDEKHMILLKTYAESILA